MRVIESVPQSEVIEALCPGALEIRLDYSNGPCVLFLGPGDDFKREVPLERLICSCGFEFMEPVGSVLHHCLKCGKEIQRAHRDRIPG